jgi:hypothetical protein
MEKNIDYDIEQYWYGFKKSMNNFYDASTGLNRPIEKWSDFLNTCQKNKDYNKIEEYIIYYISLYANDLMRIKDDYAINILNTNIKRWDKISNKYKIYSSKDNKFINLSFLLLEFYVYFLKYSKDDSFKIIFDEIEMYLVYNDFSNIIKYACVNKFHPIIDKLLDYDGKLFQQVKEILEIKDTNIRYPISAKKLFKLLITK